jgi:hypothetical protein
MTQKRHSHKAWWVVGIALLSLGILAVCLHWPMDSRIIVTPETTHIDGPLYPDGTVNYLAALDAMLSQDVTSENNAAIPLLQALGPCMLNPATRGETFRRLGMDELPAEANYFQSWCDWAPANPKWFAAATQPATRKQVNDLSYGRDSNARMAPWREPDDPAVAAWLRDNELTMRQLAAASRRSRYYVPLIAKGQMLLETVAAQPLVQLRDGARAFGARAMKRLGEGDRAGAWEDILTQARLGRLLSQSPAIVAAMLGHGFDEGAWKEGLVLLGTVQVSAQDARSMISDVEALPALRPFSELLDHGERFMTLDAVTAFFRIGHWQASSGPAAVSASAVDWNLILRDMNSHYDKQVAMLNLPTARERLARAKELGDEERKWFGGDFGERTWVRAILYRLGGRLTRGRLSDMVSHVAGGLLFANTERCVELVEVSQASREFLKVACALHAYRAEKLRYPAEMAELSPGYLKQVPSDRFSGQPLVYKPNSDGYELRSVGPNLEDEGGKGDDIRVRMPCKTVGGK